MEKEDIIAGKASPSAVIAALVCVVDHHSKEIRKMWKEIATLKERAIERDSRKENDVDSIEYGAPSRSGRVKIYINTKEIAREGQGQIDAALEALKYLKRKMEEGK